MLLLNDLLNNTNFEEAVDSIAGDFRRRYNLPTVQQLGLVVPHVETAAKELEDRGIGPFFIAKGSLARWDEYGRPGGFRGKLGLARFRGVDLELLEPGEGSDFYRADLDPDGGIVVQHLGFFVKNVDTQMTAMNRDGHPTRIRGQIRTWPFAFDFAYMDTVDTAGTIIELIRFNALGIGFKPWGGFYHFLGRLEKITGFRCIDTG